ncbi:galectin-4-like [Leucoraja erinacea]|uniref:galectin-4-like n=1 Tax=Leucoraja erinaceus TaxID=7782 RepID=UPI002456306B|nr:galectin-4-like [Leucoraja erinacea]
MMKQLPIYNPVMPFIGKIVRGLQDGKIVIIQGQVPEKAIRFEVNFVCSNSKHLDIAFHFNVRYDQSTVVCNTLENYNWGTEEIKHQIPINARSYFELIIKTCNDHFQVSVDGQHFLEYKHRLPMMSVGTLNVTGDVHVNAITFKEPDSTPAPVTVSNPVVPYKAYIGAIRPQQLIKIVGTVNTNATRFSINLMTSCWDNIALHIDQRFNENAVVRNSRIQQEWGTEERALPFLPFVPGQTFEMQIMVQSSCYAVSVNGRHLFNYNHRLEPLNQINKLEVLDDVSLSFVQY